MNRIIALDIAKAICIILVVMGNLYFPHATLYVCQWLCLYRYKKEEHLWRFFVEESQMADGSLPYDFCYGYRH